MGTSILNIWWVDDSKPGHSNQTQGLISALRRYREVEARRFVPANIRHNLRALVTAPWEPQKPSLIVSAGHPTHLTLLSLAHQHRCPSIVLMRPSLPLKLFDAVIAPAHDGLQDTNRILTTSGVINRVVPSEAQESTRGLIMLGGMNSFGAGGWSNTELEAAMPVDFQIKNAKVQAVGALVLMIRSILLR